MKPKVQPRSVFPDDVKASSFSSLLYNAYRQEWAGARLTRWALWVLVIGGFISAALLTQRWLGPVIAVVLYVTLVAAIVWQRRREFVHFEEQAIPEVRPAKLPASDKITIYATGYFTVEGQYQHFSYLPGFARTFATGEHAILCLARPRSFAAVARWPVLEEGMWYIFFSPEDVKNFRYGMLTFADKPQPAIAIDYTLNVPASSARRAKDIEETLYLVCADEADTPRLLADLLYGL